MTDTISHTKIAIRPRFSGLLPAAFAILPGLALCMGIALAAMAVQGLTGLKALSPLMLAMVFGIAIRNSLGMNVRLVDGVKFSLRRILRCAIVLLGFQLSLDQLAAIGLTGFGAVAVTLIASFVAIKLVGRLLGVDDGLTALIAVGTSVCGASAVVAANTVVRGTDEDAAYAIACVTVFGSLSMVLFPHLAQWLAMSDTHYGLWVGASVHEVAQVTGAAFQNGQESGQLGTVAKLTRVALLAPLILVLGALAARHGGQDEKAAAPLPWFVFGFIAVVVINTFAPLPAPIREVTVSGTTIMLTIALAAMGLETDFRKLKEKGLRPLLLGAFGWLFISVLAWVLLM